MARQRLANPKRQKARRFLALCATSAIILCKKKYQTLVEITLPKDANIHAREYQLYLPSKEELQAKLAEWCEEVVDERG